MIALHTKALQQDGCSFPAAQFNSCDSHMALKPPTADLVHNTTQHFALQQLSAWHNNGLATLCTRIAQLAQHFANGVAFTKLEPLPHQHPSKTVGRLAYAQMLLRKRHTATHNCNLHRFALQPPQNCTELSTTLCHLHSKLYNMLNKPKAWPAMKTAIHPHDTLAQCSTNTLVDYSKLPPKPLHFSLVASRMAGHTACLDVVSHPPQPPLLLLLIVVTTTIVRSGDACVNCAAANMRRSLYSTKRPAHCCCCCCCCCRLQASQLLLSGGGCCCCCRPEWPTPAVPGTCLPRCRTCLWQCPPAGMRSAHR